VSDERVQRCLSLTEELLRIPSETGHEAEITDFLERRLAACEPHASLRAGLNLCVAAREPDPDKRTVLLLGHTDTVPGLDDNPVRREGDRIYGLGASDMKAADAVIVEVLLRNRDQPFRHNLVGVLYASEETAYHQSGMPEIYDAARSWFDLADLAICMEPTDNQIELGCLGTSHALVTFEGERAHSARPWQGDNAIHKAAGLLGRLAAREPVTHEYHGLEFVEVMSATTVGYRGARNVIPDRCSINVNYRFPPGMTREGVERVLEEIVAGEGTCELQDFCPAGLVCGDNPLVAELREATGGAKIRAKQAWTDVGRLSHLGLDAINWGPGTVAQAHQKGEWVSVSEIARCVDALGRWLGG